MLRNLLIFIAIMAAAATVAVAGGPDRRAAEAAERKADMVFLEALRHKETGDPDAYVDLIIHAYGINPSDPFLGFEYGRFQAAAHADDSVAAAEGYALMRRYVADGPGADNFNHMSSTIETALRQGQVDDALSMLSRLYRANPDRSEVAFTYAQILASKGDTASIARAFEVFDTIEAREGALIPVSTRRIQMHLTRGDTAAVFDEARHIVALAPTASEISVFAGDVFAQFGQPDSAMSYYDRALVIDPESGPAYFSRANLYLAEGDSSAYNREVLHALVQPDLDMETINGVLYEYVANLYKNPSQRSTIDSTFVKLIELHPHEASIHGLYANFLAATAQLERAAEQASYEVDLDPSDVERWRFLSALYFSTDRLPEAAATAERAMALFPDSDIPLLLAIQAYGEMEEYDKARSLIESAMANEAFDANIKSDLVTALGDILYKGGSPDSAFVYYDKALELNPDNYLAMNNCAYFLACSDRDLDRAEELIACALAGRPDDPTTLDTYAWVMFKRGNYAKAQELIDRTLELSEEDGETPSAELLEHAGDIYFMVRQPDKALEFWKQALELNPSSDLLRRKVTSKTYFYE